MDTLKKVSLSIVYLFLLVFSITTYRNGGGDLLTVAMMTALFPLFAVEITVSGVSYVVYWILFGKPNTQLQPEYVDDGVPDYPDYYEN